MTTAAEIVAQALAADDDNSGVVMLLESESGLARLVAVWRNVPVPDDPDPQEECPEAIQVRDRFRWVWCRLEPDPIPTWIAYAGLPDAPHVRRLIQMAVNNRIVFPNGSMSKWAEVYIQRQARSVLGVRDERQQPAPPPAPAAPPSPSPEPTPVDPFSGGMIRPRRM